MTPVRTGVSEIECSASSSIPYSLVFADMQNYHPTKEVESFNEPLFDFEICRPIQ